MGAEKLVPRAFAQFREKVLEAERRWGRYVLGRRQESARESWGGGGEGLPAHRPAPGPQRLSLSARRQEGRICWGAERVAGRGDVDSGPRGPCKPVQPQLWKRTVTTFSRRLSARMRDEPDRVPFGVQARARVEVDI